jgi:beta-lactamase class A
MPYIRVVLTLVLTMLLPPLHAVVDSLPTGVQVAVRVETLSGQVLFDHRGDAPVPSASVIKIPILAVMMEEAGAGRLDWSEPALVELTEMVGGAGTLHRHGADTTLTWRQLAELMIAVSDNTATNEIIRRLGMDTINRYLSDWGMNATRLRRFMMDFEAARAGRDNTTSALDTAAILRRYAADPEFIRILLLCDDKATLPAGFPAGTAFAHKTGVLDWVRGDAGILTERGIVVAAFVQGAASTAEAERILADIGRALVPE